MTGDDFKRSALQDALLNRKNSIVINPAADPTAPLEKRKTLFESESLHDQYMKEKAEREKEEDSEEE